MFLIVPGTCTFVPLINNTTKEELCSKERYRGVEESRDVSSSLPWYLEPQLP